MASKPISQRAYARHRGVTHTAVQRAIASGRLAASVHRTESGRFLGIEPELADREWDEHTDPTKPTGALAEPKPSIDAVGQTLLPGIEPEAPRKPPATLQDAETLDARKRGIQATTIKAVFAAKLTELEYKKEAGSLCSVDAVDEAYAEIARNTRNLILAIPPRLRAVLAAETDESRVGEILEAELRKALENLSGQFAARASARKAS